MTIETDPSIPLYIQIKDYLHQQIKQGVYSIGERLPSERELSQMFKVSRMTARQALQSMVQEGIAHTRAGKGTYVRPPIIDREIRSLTSFSQEMKNRGLTHSSLVLEAFVRPADYEIASLLKIHPNSEIVLLSRVRIASGQPLAIETAYLVHSMCPGILEKHDFGKESLYEVLRNDFGWILSWADQTIEARLPLSCERKLLGINNRIPVLSMNRITFTNHNVPIEYVRSTYRGDRYQLHTILRTLI